MDTILIIDDDHQLRLSFTRLLDNEGYHVISASSGEAGLEMATRTLPDLVIVDIRLPKMNGLEVFQAIHRIEPKLPVILMTAFGTTETAIEATKQGAFDYILKPFDIPDMLQVIAKALEAGRFKRSPVAMNANPIEARGETIIGNSPAMQAVYKTIGRVSTTDATVLIRGESGTGKELVARAVYQHSQRRDNPFLIINCVAIPDSLLESELFGYERGAFTGAAHRRLGKIEQANQGTIFLDEIGDMPLNLQSKLLRLLQERRIERIGAYEPIDVDVRIIAATNRDLEAAIQKAQFREDLYYRLKVVTIQLPPLRERGSDIELLAAFFLARFTAEHQTANPGLSPAAIDLLTSHTWPGNVRELANTIQESLIFNRGTPLSATDIGQAIGPKRQSTSTIAAHESTLRQFVRTALMVDGSPNRFDAAVDRIACLLIREALHQTGGNRSAAANLLGLSRPTLHAKIKKYGIKIETAIRAESTA